MLVYTVTCALPSEEECERYLGWLEDDHLADVVRAGAVSGEAVRLDGFVRVSDRIVDLSHRGASLIADGLVREGDEIVLTFRAPRSRAWIDALAEVRRVERDGTFGVRFTELEWEARAALFVELAGVPPRVPRARILPDYAASVRRIAASSRARL